MWMFVHSHRRDYVSRNLIDKEVGRLGSDSSHHTHTFGERIKGRKLYQEESEGILRGPVALDAFQPLANGRHTRPVARGLRPTPFQDGP
jgi:hypothetical protein